MLPARRFPCPTVSRQAATNDRRAVNVTLTDEGRRLVDDAMAELLEGERTLLTGLDAQEQGALAAYLKRLLVGFEC